MKLFDSASGRWIDEKIVSTGISWS